MAAEEQLPYPPEPPPGISLEELAAAFAQAMGHGGAPGENRQSAGGDEGSAAMDGAAGGGANGVALGESPNAQQGAISAGRETNACKPNRKPAAVREPIGASIAAAASDFVPASNKTPPAPTSETDDGTDAPCPITPASVLEAMLFVGNRDGTALAPARAAELMRGVSPGEIAGLVDELNARYSADGRPYAVVSEGSGYRLKLRPEFASLRDRFYGKMREARLSQAAVDILAIVAYQQPLTAEQINRLRGKPSGHMLSQLVHRQLLRIERAGPRRTAQYYTTDRFLRLFGLESLDDLPRD